MVVSGRCRARAKEVKAVAESPRPWRRRRMFGGGCGCVCCGEHGGGVMVRERWEGKSARVGGFLGMETTGNDETIR